MTDASDNPKKGNTNQEANKSDLDVSENFSLRKLLDFLFKNKAGMWTAIFTAVLSAFTYLLWDVSKSADETARVSQQAFVNFAGPQTGVNVTNPARTEWLGQEMTLNWVNSGNTPASHIEIRSKAQAWRSDLPADYDFPTDKTAGSSTIGPKGIYGTNVSLTKNDVVDTWNSTSKLFFWGSLTYRDIFYPKSKEHLTEFCITALHIVFANPLPDFKQPIPANFAGIAAMQWQACPQHNCYDGDCKDYDERIKDANPH